MGLQAFRTWPGPLVLSAGKSTPWVSSRVMASSGLVGEASSQAGGRFLLGGPGESDGCLFVWKLEDSHPIVNPVFLCITARQA